MAHETDKRQPRVLAMAIFANRASSDSVTHRIFHIDRCVPGWRFLQLRPGLVELHAQLYQYHDITHDSPIPPTNSVPSSIPQSRGVDQ